ncbi:MULTISPECIES: sensor histidine kinase [Stenotrophomonas]|uniref:histidine kinase n=1 Tax=Stenotrophomonas nitritireducens TaxID=83617 RepID=A0ABR5NG10_9GAMM|nr:MULTISPECIES: sensor histidine kinase [Stenotrophomonas]KQO00340.1 histidine kinase [Stenotrophomonas sp. Leaf70]KRG54325.1 histidine kinase [Stenotrophomonas nitritireducens]
MKPSSLRLRLLAVAATAILLAMVAAVLVMGLIFSRHLEQGLSRELTREALQLVAGLHVDAGNRLVLDATLADPRFDLPGSGRYWQFSGDGQQERSRSLWDESLPQNLPVGTAQWTTHKIDGPFGQRLLVVERTVRVEGGQRLVHVQLAQDLAELDGARREFRTEMALFLGLLWLALVAATWIQVDLGLSPLRRVREELEVMRRSPAARLGEKHPREVMPLVAAINQLAEARESDLARARKRAADLAHSLKTPLAALGAQNRRARETGAAEAADGMDRAIAAVAAAVEAELARSRAAAIRGRHQSMRSRPGELAERVFGVIERTERGARMVFENEVDPALELPVAAEDLMEMLGALLENAVRFARRRVRIRAEQAVDETVLFIEDDGEGLDISAEQALMRGGRLDEASHAHHGLGLAIVRDLVEATQGTIVLDRSALGGLEVRLGWPQAS